MSDQRRRHVQARTVAPRSAASVRRRVGGGKKSFTDGPARETRETASLIQERPAEDGVRTMSANRKNGYTWHNLGTGKGVFPRRTCSYERQKGERNFFSR